MKSFDYIRIPDSAFPIPPAQDETLDIVVLDMNHGWPNIGHHALVDAVRELTDKFFADLDAPPLSVRVFSFDVRQGQAVPRFDRNRFRLFLGTGGPGHINPRKNDGEAEFAQGIDENAAWQKPTYALFEKIFAADDVAFIAVCHTFGVLCHWSGIATPVLRGAEKGGKSSGLVPNWLSDEAVHHPYFSEFASALPNRRFRVIDNRLFDLIPTGKFNGAVPLAWESSKVNDPDNSLTMVEFARDRGGVMPRILAVNHHPEIIDRLHLMKILDEKLSRGEVSGIWYRERAAALGQQFDSAAGDQSVKLTSDYTLLQPLEFHLRRLIEERSAIAR